MPASKRSTAAGDPLILTRAFLRGCRRFRRRPKVADSSGMQLTGGNLLLRTLIVRRLLNRVLAGDEKYVGVLLPPSVAGVLANVALPLAARVAVNVNYTMPADTINHCLEQCGIRRVITSRRVMDRLKIDLKAELIYLEDFAAQATWRDKLAAALEADVLPLGLLERRLGVDRVRPGDTLTVIFTSGSTGQPKGVVLSYDNVGSNIRSIDEAIHLGDDDVAIGVLPFFHSYGYTATMWTVLALSPKGVYHYNPLDAKEVGKLCREHRVTVFMGTPTFLRSYLRRCDPEDFSSLDVVFGAAEKLTKDLADAFEKKFGMRPLEAYGATELSPLVAVNVPDSRAPPGRSPHESMAREGSVGKPIPGVEIKVVDPESWQELPRGESGMLLVGGRGVMQGYLNQPELTAKVIRDGWYVTGDIARIDDDGFLFITGRQSRFSKIGGEMAPHIKIEETLQQVLGLDEELRLVVTAVPDAKKGERLVVIHTGLPKPPEEIVKLLAQAGLPNLWIPGQDSFCQVEKIPVLGTGKLDLHGVRQLALEKFGAN